MVKKLKKNSLKNKQVVIGYFDLIHKKHQELINKNSNVVVLTFKHLPNKQDSYNSFKDRVKLLQKQGIKNIYYYDVLKNNMSASAFVNKYLLQTKKVIVGSDFKLGNDIRSILTFQDTLNLDLLDYDVNYSTTQVKQALLMGDIVSANQLLTTPFSVTDKVVHGEALGRTIGFPTANFKLDKNIMMEGVYLTKTKYKNKWYKSITLFGKPSTIGNKQTKLMETHIIDFDGNLYGHKIEVCFYQYLNQIVKFNSKEELINAINNYKQTALSTDY